MKSNRQAHLKHSRPHIFTRWHDRFLRGQDGCPMKLHGIQARSGIGIPGHTRLLYRLYRTQPPASSAYGRQSGREETDTRRIPTESDGNPVSSRCLEDVRVTCGQREPQFFQGTRVQERENVTDPPLRGGKKVEDPVFGRNLHYTGRQSSRDRIGIGPPSSGHDGRQDVEKSLV